MQYTQAMPILTSKSKYELFTTKGCLQNDCIIKAVFSVWPENLIELMVNG